MLTGGSTYCLVGCINAILLPLANSLKMQSPPDNFAYKRRQRRDVVDIGHVEDGVLYSGVGQLSAHCATMSAALLASAATCTVPSALRSISS